MGRKTAAAGPEPHFLPDVPFFPLDGVPIMTHLCPRCNHIYTPFAAGRDLSESFRVAIPP